MTSACFMPYYIPSTSVSQFMQLVSSKLLFNSVSKGGTIKCKFIASIAFPIVFILICVSLFGTSHSAEKSSCCYSCHMKSPVKGNYLCFLARSLIVIVGYVNLTYTCYKSILTCHVVRWIEETFLVLLVKVSYTKYMTRILIFLCNGKFDMYQVFLSSRCFFYGFTVNAEFIFHSMIHRGM
jgi:hypothetical protein